MQVLHDGFKYYITFKYLPDKKGRPHRTVCWIEERPMNRPATMLDAITILGVGESRCNYKEQDVYNKEEGRFRALKAALDPTDSPLPRPVRAALYEAYRNRATLRGALKVTA